MTLVSKRKVATIMCDSSLIATILEIQGCVTVHYVMHGSDNDFDIEVFLLPAACWAGLESSSMDLLEDQEIGSWTEDAAIISKYIFHSLSIGWCFQE
jgi:hypothetical protein